MFVHLNFLEIRRKINSVYIEETDSSTAYNGKKKWNIVRIFSVKITEDLGTRKCRIEALNDDSVIRGTSRLLSVIFCEEDIIASV